VFTVENGELRIDLLDPVLDAARLGPRFCWGGYMWQVQDRAAGPLLRGPEWPETAPSPFNGQGLPESFRHRTFGGHPLTWRGEHGVALGAGELRHDCEGNVQVTVPCRWEIVTGDNVVTFTTDHAAAGFHYALERRIELTGRDVLSLTRLTNRSSHEPLALEWFAHPFFALVDGEVQAQISAPCSVAENPGFTLTSDGILRQTRRFTRVDDGHMERSLRLADGQPLRAQLAHPAIEHVRFETSFAPDACVLWGNDRTFSLEPYLTLALAPGQAREWSVRYRFGASSGISSSSASARVPPA
jgi:hypothetical protein